MEVWENENAVGTQVLGKFIIRQFFKVPSDEDSKDDNDDDHNNNIGDVGDDNSDVG